MKNFFLSLKTTVWTLFVLVCLFFIGSGLMPAYRDVFAPLNDDLLLNWITGAAAENPWQTWWFFGALAGLAVLTINTLACSIEAVAARWSRSEFLLRVSPQIMHAGFILILFAHLLSAVSGYKLSGMLPEGGFGRLPEDRGVLLQEIRVQTDASGYMTDWTAAVSLYEKDRIVKSDVLRPNKPVFYRGIGVYLKTLNFDRGPSAFLMIVKDPGAVWALAGGLLFMLGSVTLLALKLKRA